MRWRRIITTLIIVLGFVLHMAVIIPSGSRYCANDQCGVFFWGAHEHDAVWHLALANTTFAGETQVLPNYTGATLSGYNALLDLVLHTLSQLTTIEVSIWYFKIIPIGWFALLSYLTYNLARRLSTNPWLPACLLFFVYFGNSFSYLLPLLQGQSLWGASGLLTMQAPQTLTNIQFALSLPLLIYLLILVRKPKHGLLKQVVLGVLVFLMLGLKFYAGVVGALLVGLYYLVTYRQNSKRWTTFALLLLLSFTLLSVWLFYKPGHSSGSIFQFSPLSIVHPIIEEKSLFYLPGIAAARYNLYTQGFGFKLLLIEGLTLVIFIVMNFGTRILGLLRIVRQIREKRFNHFDLVVSGGILGSFLLTILLTQRGEWWNTIQFLYYSFFLLNIYAAQSLASLVRNKKMWGGVIAVLVVLLTIPNTFDTWRIFSSFPPRSYVSDAELALLTTLKEQPPGVVLALPLHAGELPNTVRFAPLHTLYDTAYVSAYSGKPTYLNDLVQLRLIGIDYRVREQAVIASDCTILDSVSYIYIAGEQSLIEPYQQCEGSLGVIEQNSAGTLYLVNR